MFSDQKRRDGPFIVVDNDLVFSNLKFQPLCSEIATVKVVIPSGPAPFPANIAFSDHLVAIPSVNTLNLAAFIWVRRPRLLLRRPVAIPSLVCGGGLGYLDLFRVKCSRPLKVDLPRPPLTRKLNNLDQLVFSPGS